MPRHGNVAGFLMAKPTIRAALRFNLEISSDSFDPVSAFELSAFPGTTALYQRSFSAP